MKKILVSLFVVMVAGCAFMMLTNSEIFKRPNDSEPMNYQPNISEIVEDSTPVNDTSSSDSEPSYTKYDPSDPTTIEKNVANEVEYFGVITVEVVDESGQTVINQVIGFNESDDDLIALLKTEFPVYCGNAQYEPDETCETNVLFGRTLLGIDDVVTDWYSSFIAIYVNDTYSHVGIDNIVFVDGDVIRFVFTSLG